MPLRYLHDIPFRRKLTIITMLTSTAALTVACVAFTIYDQVSLRRDLVDALSSTAEMIGFNSASALSFNDPASAEQTLRSISAQKHVVMAAVYDRDDRIFATYHRGGELTRPFPAIPPPEGHAFSGDAI